MTSNPDFKVTPLFDAEYVRNKCIEDDMKAAARKSLNSIKR